MRLLSVPATCARGPWSRKHHLLWVFLFVFFQQCYLYEFVGDGSAETVQCPSAAFLYAIVSFSYNDPKLTLITAEYERYPEMRVSSV